MLPREDAAPEGAALRGCCPRWSCLRRCCPKKMLPQRMLPRRVLPQEDPAPTKCCPQVLPQESASPIGYCPRRCRPQNVRIHSDLLQSRELHQKTAQFCKHSARAGQRNLRSPSATMPFWQNLGSHRWLFLIAKTPVCQMLNSLNGILTLPKWPRGNPAWIINPAPIIKRHFLR